MSPTRLRWALLARSFLVQGSWNYRTILGSGFAWALLPALRSRDSESPSIDRVARAAAPFNTHPYLSPIALGAVAKLEREGVDPERLTRFRDALRSPLGGLGDGLIWAAWRPVCLLGAVLAVLLGAPPLAAVLGFLVVYNVLHLRLRVWGIRVGFESGFDVGPALARARIPVWAERISLSGVLLLGLVSGVLTGSAGALAWQGVPWVIAGAALLAVGLLGRDALRRGGPTVLLLLFLLGAFLVPGWFASPGG